MIHHFVIKEAIHSVAMEHPSDCDCLTCRAADGDEEALVEIYRSFETNDRI